jgi:hypothetical protein
VSLTISLCKRFTHFWRLPLNDMSRKRGKQWNKRCYDPIEIWAWIAMIAFWKRKMLDNSLRKFSFWKWKELFETKGRGRSNYFSLPHSRAAR